MQVFHWSWPYSRPYDSRVGCKSRGQKSTKKGRKILGRLHLPDKTWNIQACLYLVADLPLGSGCFLQDWSGNYQDKP